MRNLSEDDIRNVYCTMNIKPREVKYTYLEINISPKRHPNIPIPINIMLRTLNPRNCSPKEQIPSPSLLSIIIALLPSSAMMQIMIFDDQIGLKKMHSGFSGFGVVA